MALLTDSCLAHRKRWRVIIRYTRAPIYTQARQSLYIVVARQYMLGARQSLYTGAPIISIRARQQLYIGARQLLFIHARQFIDVRANTIIYMRAYIMIVTCAPHYYTCAPNSYDVPRQYRVHPGKLGKSWDILRIPGNPRTCRIPGISYKIGLYARVDSL